MSDIERTQWALVSHIFGKLHRMDGAEYRLLWWVALHGVLSARTLARLTLFLVHGVLATAFVEGVGFGYIIAARWSL